MGTFLNKLTGVAALKASTPPDGPWFQGSIREWYETLIETIIDAADDILCKTSRGPGNVIVVSPEMLTLLQHSVAFRPDYHQLGGPSEEEPVRHITSKLEGKFQGFLNNRFAVVCNWDHYPEDKAKIRVLAYDIRGVLFARKTIHVHDLCILEGLEANAT